MNEAHESPDAGSAEADQSALFAHLVLQQSNLALMLLGKAPHPESGKVVKDVETAKLIIDQLEMLEVKTKGNLSKDESGLLKQSLMTLHLAFVDAVEKPANAGQATPSEGAQAGATAQPAPAQDATPSGTAADEDHRVKFSKKY